MRSTGVEPLGAPAAALAVEDVDRAEIDLQRAPCAGTEVQQLGERDGDDAAVHDHQRPFTGRARQHLGEAGNDTAAEGLAAFAAGVDEVLRVGLPAPEFLRGAGRDLLARPAFPVAEVHFVERRHRRRHMPPAGHQHRAAPRALQAAGVDGVEPLAGERGAGVPHLRFADMAERNIGGAVVAHARVAGRLAVPDQHQTPDHRHGTTGESGCGRGPACRGCGPPGPHTSTRSRISSAVAGLSSIVSRTAAAATTSMTTPARQRTAYESPPRPSAQRTSHTASEPMPKVQTNLRP